MRQFSKEQERQLQQALREIEEKSQARKRAIMGKLTKRWAAETAREQANLTGGRR